MTDPTQQDDSTNQDADAETETDAEGRYGTFETMGGETVVFDRENPDAWIQSSVAVAVAVDAETEAAE